MLVLGCVGALDINKWRVGIDDSRLNQVVQLFLH